MKRGRIVLPTFSYLSLFVYQPVFIFVRVSEFLDRSLSSEIVDWHGVSYSTTSAVTAATTSGSKNKHYWMLKESKHFDFLNGSHWSLFPRTFKVKFRNPEGWSIWNNSKQKMYFHYLISNTFFVVKKLFWLFLCV